MHNFEANDFRPFFKLMNPHADFDAAYTFYYDETNNIKKLHLKNGDFNAAFSSNFVLGGLAFKKTAPDISDIFSGLRLQATVNEVKLKHIATGDFTACLTSDKLTIFLQQLLSFPLYLHFSSVNLLYYSVVDIVDSALATSDTGDDMHPGLIRRIKNDLYKVCRLEIQKVTELFINYGYPNVQEDQVRNFIADLLAIFVPYEADAEYHFGLTTLKQLLKESEKDGSLPFIMDNNNLILIEGLAPFYMRPVYTFVNATHIFDNEAEIVKELENYNFTADGKALNNFSFLDSKTDLFVQASDIIIGLTGKLSKFFNTHTTEEITRQVSSMNSRQLTNLDLYLDLVSKTEKENPGLFQYTDSDDDHSKNQLLFRLRNKQ